MVEATPFLDEETRAQLAITLFETGGLVVTEDGADQWTSTNGRESPYHIDSRVIASDPRLRLPLASGIVELACKRTNSSEPADLYRSYQWLLGTDEYASTVALTTTVSDITQLRRLPVRVYHDYGTQVHVEGPSEAGQNLAVISLGAISESPEAVAEGANRNGLFVTDYFVAFDREEGLLPRHTERTGVVFTPVLRISEIVRTLRESGDLSTAQFHGIARYIESYGEPEAQATLAA